MKTSSLTFLKENLGFTPMMLRQSLGQAEAYRVMAELLEAGIMGKIGPWYEVLLDGAELLDELERITPSDEVPKRKTEGRGETSVILLSWPDDLFRPGAQFMGNEIDKWDLPDGAVFYFTSPYKGKQGAFQHKKGGWVKMEMKSFSDAPAWLIRACEIVGFTSPATFIEFASGDYVATVWSANWRAYSFDKADKEEAERVTSSFSGYPPLQGYDRQISKRA